jgi:hypothetical protein
VSKSVQEQMADLIAKHSGVVLMRSDFKAIGSQRQISRALKKLIGEGVIVRFGHGLYARARPSVLSGRPVPMATPAELTAEVLEKLGIPVRPGKAQEAYATGKTPDVPVHTAFNTGKHRITRKIIIGKTHVRFENDYSKD